MATREMNKTLNTIRISDYPEFDRRRKLSNDDIEAIKRAWFGVHEAERPTLTELGERFGVHRTRISMILNPEREEKQRERRRQKDKAKRYYNRETSRKNIQNYRVYKEGLVKQGKLQV